ncbi:J domain-containing protein [Citrus sinensis]|uniref:J domain-containing protein n=1 Tax=Citrus sinensis TaxID=2711 RepID=A0ACB8JA89_CITSI|nr:J domain-containing protein [Citrus sinensis]
MANGEEKSSNFYAVLGLNKECTATELRNAYKKLALRWHPDRCSASGNAKFVDEAKKKFQTIQHAYSVLSDANKRLLYDVGVYDSDDDGDNNGMGDFLNEMAAMMSQTQTNENGEETFEELQNLFEEMFQGDNDAFGSSSQCTSSCSNSSSSYVSYTEISNPNKRNSCEMNSTKSNTEGTSSFNTHFQSFCEGTGGTPARLQEREGNRRRNRRRGQK